MSYFDYYDGKIVYIEDDLKFFENKNNKYIGDIFVLENEMLEYLVNFIDTNPDVLYWKFNTVEIPCKYELYDGTINYIPLIDVIYKVKDSTEYIKEVIFDIDYSDEFIEISDDEYDKLNNDEKQKYTDELVKFDIKNLKYTTASKYFKDIGMDFFVLNKNGFTEYTFEIKKSN